MKHPTTRTGAAAVALSASVALAAGALATALPASASASTVATVADAQLDWPISRCASDPAVPACGSLTGIQATAGNATKQGTSFRFTSGTGTYDTATGATALQFNGSVTVGNVTRGNYSVRFADPVISAPGNGTATLSADVTYTLNGAAPVTTDDVPVAEVSGVPVATAWSATPATFSAQLLTALDPSLRGWFSQTGSPGTDPHKVPAAVTLGFSGTLPPAPVASATPSVSPSTAPAVTPSPTSSPNQTALAQPTLTITPKRGLPVDKATTVTVRGSGFNPAVKSQPGVMGMYVTFGPNAATTPGGYSQAGTGSYYDAQWIATIPDANGSFTAKVKVLGKYTDKAGKQWNGRNDVLGVSTWAAHGHTTTAWDSFTRVEFAKPVAAKASSTTRTSIRKAPWQPGATGTIKVAVRTSGRATGDLVVRAGTKRLAPVRAVRLRAAADGARLISIPVRDRWAGTTVKVRTVFLGNGATKRSTSSVKRVQVAN